MKTQSIFATVSTLLLFLVIIWGFMPNVYSQNVYEEDVLYLKNGGVIRGTIIEQVPGEHVKIELLGGSIFVFTEEEIDVVTKEPMKYAIQPSRRAARLKRPISFREKQWYYQVSTNLGIGTDVSSVNLHYRMGYYFNHYLGIGIGAGLDRYEEGLIIPVYVDIQGDLWKKKIAPHYYLNAGYGFAVSPSWFMDELQGGYHGQVGIGLKINTRSRSEWIIDGGFKLQDSWQLGSLWGDPALTFQGSRLYRRLILGVTFGF